MRNKTVLTTIYSQVSNEPECAHKYIAQCVTAPVWRGKLEKVELTQDHVQWRDLVPVMVNVGDLVQLPVTPE
jgi:hypothetical protein